MITTMLSNMEAYESNQKYNWVYNTINLLDFQKIQWSPYKTETFMYRAKMFTYLDGVESQIFLEDGDIPCEEVSLAVVKGEVKWYSNNNIDGGLKLKIHALISLKMSKYTGVLTILHSKDSIWAASLTMKQSLFDEQPKEIQNKILKVCNGKTWGHCETHTQKQDSKDVVIH